MKYTHLIKAIDLTSQQMMGRAAVAVNQSLVIRNWLIGAYIVEFEQHGEDRAKYGARLMEKLAADLKRRGHKGLSVPMLGRMRAFYQAYPQLAARISSPVVTESRFLLPFKPLPDSITTGDRIGSQGIRKSTKQKSNGALASSPDTILCFSWSKLLELIRISDPLKRAFYEVECLKGNWSKRQLQRQIGSLLFERTGLSKDKEAVIARARRQEPRETIEDLIRDPYVLEFTGLAELPKYTESDLETALLDHLQKFLLELGAGFLFEARQRRITVGNEHDYIDLVFYHRHLRCHVLLDLKTRPFTHGDAGQMNFYLNWWQKNLTTPDEQPPVGIILCSDRDQTKVEFATAGMNNKLFVSRYLHALPSAGQIERFVEKDRARTEALMESKTSPPRSSKRLSVPRSKRKKSAP